MFLCLDVAHWLTHLFIYCSGEAEALSRTGHGACIKPNETNVIVIFGGYSVSPGQQRGGTWRNDIVEFDVCTKTCRSVEARNPPAPRAHMTFHRIGDYCVSLFGRSGAKTLISKHKCLAVYDPSTQTWLDETSGKGDVPTARYSHVSSVWGSNLIVFGGVLDKADSSGGGTVSVLHVDQKKNAFIWLKGGSKRQDFVQHRVGHVQNIIDDTLYIMGGFYQHSYHDDVNSLKFFIGETYFNCVVCDSGIAISESAISETEDPISCSKSMTKRQRRTLDALHGELNGLSSLRPDKAPKGSVAYLEKELAISDLKWKEAKEESLNWKKLAEEEREKSDRFAEKLVQAEHKYLTLSKSLSMLAEFFRLGDLDSCYDSIGGYITQKVADYERIRKESRGTLAVLHGQVHKYQENQEQLESTLAQCRKDSENLEITYKSLLEKSANDMKLLMSRYSQDTSKSKAELNNLRNQIDVLNTDLDMRASYCADLEKSCTELRTKCTDLESALRDIKDQMRAKEEENGTLQKKLSAIKQAIAENV